MHCDQRWRPHWECIDDVLAGVTKGPLASEAVDGEDGTGQATGVAPGRHRTTSTRQRAAKAVDGNRCGMTTMAAAVILFVAPMTDEAIKGPDYFPTMRSPKPTNQRSQSRP